MLRKLVIPAILALAGCNTTSTPFEGPTRGFTPDQPAAQVISAPAPQAPAVLRANSAVAQDFMNLTFALESGTRLNTFTRFEGPIRVSLSGNVAATTRNDLNALLGRLRNEAGLNIQTSSNGGNIQVQMVQRASIQQHIPNAACFVAPNVRSLSEFGAKRRTASTSWSFLSSRTLMSIFIPSDASPKEIRDCLHEEIAQALGPVNDLYALNNSVFNDDNIHSVLTPFDMLVLRVHYDGALQNGMTPAQVQARLPGILARLNPAGQSFGAAAASDISERWDNAIERAMAHGLSSSDRIRAAERAVQVARAEGISDIRLGFSLSVLGRVHMANDTDAAKRAFIAADSAYAAQPGTGLHRAFVASFQAAIALSEQNTQTAIALARQYTPLAQRHQNADLLATLRMLEAEALDRAGFGAQADTVRLDTLAHARYGFGSEQAVEARLMQIATLSPR